MRNPAWRRRRLAFLFALALVSTALTPAAATADVVVFSGGSTPEFDSFIDGFPNRTYTRKVGVTIHHSGAEHLVPGSQVVLSPGPLAPAWTAGDVTITVPQDWQIGMTARVDAVVTYATSGTIFPTQDHYLVWNPVSMNCTLGGTSCLTVDRSRRIDVRSKPNGVGNLQGSPGVVDADVTWDHSPEHLQLTHYVLTRYRRPDTGGFDQVKALALSPDTSSYHDEGLSPDTLYCWRIRPQKIIPVGETGSQTLPGPEVETCARTGKYPAAPASGPAGPALDADGTFDLKWGPSADAGVTYDVERRDANDASWQPLATALSDPSFAASTHAEGTWNYRVRSTNDHASSDWVESTAAVKVDRSGPTDATAATDPAEPFEGGWFADSVAVSFGGWADPALPDGSPGSGFASSTNPQPVGGGEHTVTGTALDVAGNESSAQKSVKVDATAPTVAMACPTGSFSVGQSGAALSWTASDDQSGVKGDAGGTIALDTSQPGTRSVTTPVPVDNVGHPGSPRTCPYSVAYVFTGFLAPINGTAVNAGKAGRTYPVKWRLERSDGSLISDADAQALVGSMSATQREAACATFDLLPQDELAESSAGDTSLRYDADADQFVYNYRTPSTGGCYVLGIRNADGALTRRVNFSFTR